MIAGVAGCDDLSVLRAYSQSAMKAAIESGHYAEGNPVFSDALLRVCVVARNDDLNRYAKIKRSVRFSEDFTFLITEEATGRETVEIINWEWLHPRDGDSFCSNDAEKVGVLNVRSGQLIVGLQEGRVSR